MKKLFILFSLLVLIVACAQPAVQQKSTAPVQQEPVASDPVEEVLNNAQPAPAPTPVVMKAVAELEADDKGFYLKGEQVGSIVVKKGTPLDIEFTVRTTDVYYGGLDFRGCDANAAAQPGKTATLSFTPTESCLVKSYWPSSGVLKDTLEIKVE